MGMCAPKVITCRGAHSKKFGDNWLIATFFFQQSYYKEEAPSKSFSSLKNKMESDH